MIKKFSSASCTVMRIDIISTVQSLLVETFTSQGRVCFSKDRSLERHTEKKKGKITATELEAINFRITLLFLLL